MELYDFKNSDNVQDESNSLCFNEDELQDIYMTCSYAYELIRDDGYTREEVEKKLSFDKYLFFALKYIDNDLSIPEVIEKYTKEYFALKNVQPAQQQDENEEDFKR